ncbi:MAG TPA: AAA family ATPase [Caulobacteraceae bacterium]|nr:AAA family ATPase [Caulobacteraceae bacterium]
MTDDSPWRALTRNLGNVFRRRGADSEHHEPLTYIRASDIRAARGSALPGFQRTASDQPNPAYTEGLAVRRAKLLNTYAPTRPVTDPAMFAGRTGIVKALIHALEEQRFHVVIYGERGVGKTSLLHLLSQAARDARYLVAYIDCGQRSEFDETFRALASHVPLMFHGAYGPTSVESERGDTLASLLGPQPMTVGTSVDALARIEGTRVLLILDDFDHCGSEDFRNKIAEFLKSLSDQAVFVQALIAGVSAELAELVGHVPSLHRHVLAMQIPRMTAGEVRDIIARGEKAADVHFDDEAVRAIIAACTGLPYLAKLLGYRAALVAVQDGRRTIRAGDIDASIHGVIDELRETAPRSALLRIDALTMQGQLPVLGALARGAQGTVGSFTMEDVAAALGDGQRLRREAMSVVQDLVEHNVLIETQDDAHGDAFRFAAPSLPDYLSLLVAGSRSG